MAIGKMNYLDIPVEQRQEAAKAARQKLQAMLANPFMQAEQTAYLHERLDQVDKWEMGLMPLTVEPLVAAHPPAPKLALKVLVADAEWEET